MNAKTDDQAQDTVVAVLKKNYNEELRVAVGEYRGTPTVGVRVWFRAGDGSWRPSKAGVTCRIALLPELIEALHVASDHARRAGHL